MESDLIERRCSNCEHNIDGYCHRNPYDTHIERTERKNAFLQWLLGDKKQLVPGSMLPLNKLCPEYKMDFQKAYFLEPMVETFLFGCKKDLPTDKFTNRGLLDMMQDKYVYSENDTRNLSDYWL